VCLKLTLENQYTGKFGPKNTYLVWQLCVDLGVEGVQLFWQHVICVSMVQVVARHLTHANDMR